MQPGLTRDSRIKPAISRDMRRKLGQFTTYDSDSLLPHSEINQRPRSLCILTKPQPLTESMDPN